MKLKAGNSVFRYFLKGKFPNINGVEENKSVSYEIQLGLDDKIARWYEVKWGLVAGNEKTEHRFYSGF